MTIPETVFQQLEQIRRSGRVNMLDFRGVRSIALAFWLDDLYSYLIRHQSEYMDLLIQFGAWSTTQKGDQNGES